jgi:hypothetical protein
LTRYKYRYENGYSFLYRPLTSVPYLSRTVVIYQEQLFFIQKAGTVVRDL